MKLSEFLKDKFLFIFAAALTASFTALLLNVLGAGGYAAGFVSVMLLLGQTGALLVEYVQKRLFYNSVLKNLEQLDQKYLLSEMLEWPSFCEGQILFEVLRETNKSMNDKIAEYRRASQEYREFIETWVHEVKTPISSSRLIIENNRNDITLDLDEELVKIENYVEQALFYSRSSTVEKDYIIKEVTLKELVNSALRKNSSVLIQSGIHLQLSSLDKTVFTDAKWTDFIFGQILINAVKYRKESPKIEITGLQSENSVTLRIADNGIGIPKQDLERVFEKGFTGTNGRKIAKSTGIGLYLCKKLCTKMNLGITIQSNTNTGTAVSIVFPKSNMYT